MTTEVKISWSLPVVFTPKKEWILATCPVLDLHTQGDTIDEAKANIIEAIRLFIESCIRRGTLDNVLRECGFKVSKKKMQTKVHLSEHIKKMPGLEYINVPIPLIVNNCYQR